MTSEAIESLARAVSKAPHFTFEHLATARAGGGLSAISLPPAGRPSKSRAKRAEAEQTARVWLRQQLLEFQDQVLPDWKLVTWVERMPPPFKVSVYSGFPEWHKIHDVTRRDRPV